MLSVLVFPRKLLSTTAVILQRRIRNVALGRCLVSEKILLQREALLAGRQCAFESTPAPGKY